MSQLQPQPQSQPTKLPLRNHGGTLSQDSIPKFVELKRLLYRHPTTFPNPDIIIQGARHFCMPLSIRNDLIGLEHDSSNIAEYWVRVPV